MPYQFIRDPLKIEEADRLATTEIYLNLTESHVIEEFQNKW